MREGSLPPDRVGTKSVNKRAAARRGGAEMALGEAADSRAKVSWLFRFSVFPQSLSRQHQISGASSAFEDEADRLR